MASQQNGAVFPEEDLDDEDDESQEYEEEEEEDDDDVVLGEPEDDEETEPSPSTSSALTATATVTVAMPGSVVSKADKAPISTATATTIVVSNPSDPKRQRSEQIEEKKPLDDSRKLFQRLWTDEDEIGLLQGFLEYTTQRGSSHHNDTALFYDQIKSKLQLGFNKNQLVEKLRRLKKKYRNVLNKIGSGKDFSFKSPHDHATFEISRKIWSNTAPIGGAIEDNNALDDDEINLNPNPNPNPNPSPNPNPNFGHSMSLKNEANSTEKRTPPSRKRSRSRSGVRTEEKRDLNDGSALIRDNNNNYISNNNDNNSYNDNNNNNNNCNYSRSIPGLIEETVRSCLSPILKELLRGVSGVGSPFGGRGFGVGGLALNPFPLPLGLNLGIGEVGDDKWRKQQILELEVYSKRLELVQDEIKAALDELRSAGAGG